MRAALYPGSFDPITYGHIDIIKRIHKHYDKLTVLVANSKHKDYTFTSEERKQLIEKCLVGLDNVVVEISDGLTVDYAKNNNISVIIRGLRAIADFEYEMAMANVNKALNSDIETFIVFTSPKFNYVSSRMVKEVSLFNGDIEKLVPPEVVGALKKKQGSK